MNLWRAAAQVERRSCGEYSCGARGRVGYMAPGLIPACHRRRLCGANHGGDAARGESRVMVQLQGPGGPARAYRYRYRCGCGWMVARGVPWVVGHGSGLTLCDGSAN